MARPLQMPLRALTLGIFVALPWTALGQGRPISLAEEAARKAQRAVVDGVTQLAIKERLLAHRPETFHLASNSLDKPAIEVMIDLMVLDVALSITEYGGVENLDRIQSELQLLRRRRDQNPALTQDAIAKRINASEDERTEASRVLFTMRYLQEHPRGKTAPTTPDRPVPRSIADPVGGSKVQKSWRREWLTELKSEPLESPPPSARRPDRPADPFQVEASPTVGARERGKQSLFGALEAWLMDAWEKKDLGRLAIPLSIICALIAGTFLFVQRRKRRRA
ncbi:MAG: hypothetical protein ACE366_05300 [Bradymonadia bacterium]